jgi:hypothetical protein
VIYSIGGSFTPHVVPGSTRSHLIPMVEITDIWVDPGMFGIRSRALEIVTGPIRRSDEVFFFGGDHWVRIWEKIAGSPG